MPEAIASDQRSSLAPPAHPWRRLMGIVYESIVLFGVLWFFDYAFSALTRFEGEPGVTRHVFQAFQVLVFGAYFAGFWARGRRTLPMKTLSLQLTDRQGRPLTGGRALARYLAGLVLVVAVFAIASVTSWYALLLLALPAGWSILDRDRQSLYDRIAGTRLVTSAD